MKTFAEGARAHRGTDPGHVPCLHVRHIAWARQGGGDRDGGGHTAVYGCAGEGGGVRC